MPRLLRVLPALTAACVTEHGDIVPDGVGLDWCACTVRDHRPVEQDDAPLEELADQVAELPGIATYSPVLDAAWTQVDGASAADPSYLGASFVATFDWDARTDVRVWRSADAWPDADVATWADDTFLEATVPVTVAGEAFDATGEVDLWITRGRVLAPAFGWRAEMDVSDALTSRFMGRLTDLKPWVGDQTGVRLTIVQRHGVLPESEVRSEPGLQYQVAIATAEGLYTEAEGGALDVVAP